MKKIFYGLVFPALFIFESCVDEETAMGTETRLDYYIDSYEVPCLDFIPQMKVSYEYLPSGKLEKETRWTYNPEAETFVQQHYLRFSYSGDLVRLVEVYLPEKDIPYTTYHYVYAPDGRISTITETSDDTDMHATATFSYLEDGHINVSYAYSNGSAFQYEFDFTTGNILSDKTTRGSQLCSEGAYAYDQQKNPFHSLGYIDFLLTNLSANNKVTENINHIACAFPTLIPEAYAYEYRADGYPSSATITYHPEGALRMSKKVFIYKTIQTSE